jgi:hypothetical protein
MPRKLTNEIIDQRLIGRNIKRLDDYIDIMTKIPFQCLVEGCDFIWLATPDAITGKNKNGCPKCAGNAKLSNEYIDKELIKNNRKIKRLGNYINAVTDIPFQCLISECIFIWPATPNSILNCETGCPKCSGNIKITNEYVDQKIIGRNIKRISDYINARTEIPFQCLLESCSYIYLAVPNKDFLGGHRGCPKCEASVKHILSKFSTAETVDQFLITNNRKVKRIGEYICPNTKTPFRCLIETCNYEWPVSPRSILHAEHGCPKCAGHIVSIEEIDAKLALKNIKRLGPYITAKAKMPVQCLISDCNFEWEANTGNLLAVGGGTNCPKCSGSLPLDNNEVDRRLLIMGNKIKRLGNFINSTTKIPFQCLIESCNFKWLAVPASILHNETGCPCCSFRKNEKLTYKILLSGNFIIEAQKDIRNIIKNEIRMMRADFFLPQLNIIIEYNGAQHYSPQCFGGISQERAKENFIHQQARDLYLQQFCTINNITLIWIDGRKYTNSKLEKHIINHIIPLLKAKENNAILR